MNPPPAKPNRNTLMGILRFLGQHFLGQWPLLKNPLPINRRQSLEVKNLPKHIGARPLRQAAVHWSLAISHHFVQAQQRRGGIVVGQPEVPPPSWPHLASMIARH